MSSRHGLSSTKPGVRSVGTRPVPLRSNPVAGGSMHRVTECKASPDYKLWLKFEDGLEGSVYLGDLLELVAFRDWRDVDQFCRVAVDRKAATGVWGRGIQFDPGNLSQEP